MMMKSKKGELGKVKELLAQATACLEKYAGEEEGEEEGEMMAEDDSEDEPADDDTSMKTMEMKLRKYV